MNSCIYLRLRLCVNVYVHTHGMRGCVRAWMHARMYAFVDVGLRLFCDRGARHGHALRSEWQTEVPCQALQPAAANRIVRVWHFGQRPLTEVPVLGTAADRGARVGHFGQRRLTEVPVSGTSVSGG